MASGNFQQGCQRALDAVLESSVQNMELDWFLPRALDIFLSLDCLVSGNCGYIYLLEGADNNLLVLKAARNMPAHLEKKSSRFSLGPDYYSRAVLDRELFFYIHADGYGAADDAHQVGRVFCCVPLVALSHTVGVLHFCVKSAHVFNTQEKSFLSSYARLLAGIIVRNQTMLKLQTQIKSQQQAMDASIQAMIKLVEQRDPFTAVHQQKVANLARAIADKMRLSKDQAEGIYISGAIHDVGKVSIPADILSKPSKLTEAELMLTQQHAKAGYDILQNISFPWPVARAVLQHHERMDGSGYPAGLIGEEIIFEARVLAVADVAEAIASHRPYRPSRGIKAVTAELSENRGRLYDAHVVDAFLALVRGEEIKL